MANLRSWLYRSARLLGDVQALSSGSRKRIQRRVKNKAVGRLAYAMDFWRALWR